MFRGDQWARQLHIGRQISFCKYFHFIPFNVLPISIACVTCPLISVFTRVFIYYSSDPEISVGLQSCHAYYHLMQVTDQISSRCKCKFKCVQGVIKMKLQSPRWILTATIMGPCTCHPLVRLYNTESRRNLNYHNRYLFNWCRWQ